jgi:hypothetical protein
VNVYDSLSPSEIAEFDKLRERHAETIARADQLAHEVALASDEVRSAYDEAAKIWLSIREFLVRADLKWRESTSMKNPPRGLDPVGIKNDFSERS